MCAGVSQSETSESCAQQAGCAHCTYALFSPPLSLFLLSACYSPYLPPSLLLLSKTHQDACSEFPLRRSHRYPLSRSPLSFSLCALSHRSSPPSRRPLLLASGCPSPLPPPPSFCFATQPPLQLIRSPVTDLDVDSSDACQSSNSASATTHPPLLSLKTSALFPPPTHPASPAPHVVPLLVQSEIVRHGPHAQPLGRRRGSASQRVWPNQSVLPARPSHTSEPLSLASSNRLTRPATPPPPSSNLHLSPNSLFLPEQR